MRGISIGVRFLNVRESGVLLLKLLLFLVVLVMVVVHVCICLSVCVYAFVHVSVLARGQQLCLSQLLFTYVFKAEALTEPTACKLSETGGQELSGEQRSSVPSTEIIVTMPSILPGCTLSSSPLSHLPIFWNMTF